MAIGIGVACLTAGIGLAGCGGSSNTGETTETTTITETTTAETTTTMAETTTTTTEAPTEAWKEKYADAIIIPKENPDDVWGNEEKIEVRLNNGIHIYLPLNYRTKDMVETYRFRFSEFYEDNPDYHNGYLYNEEYGDNVENSPVRKCNSNAVEGLAGEIPHIMVIGMITDEMPQSDATHRYSALGEKDGKKYVLDLNPGWYGPPYGTGYIVEWSARDEEFYNAYAKKIVNTAWVDSDTTETTNEYPEDDQLMENLRNFYMSNEKVDGVPVYRNSEFKKFAIADFDADGKNEVMVEKYYDINGSIGQDLSMYEADSPIGGNYSNCDKMIPDQIFSDVTFLDNGVAHITLDGWSFDNRVYFLLNEDMPKKFNYDMSLTYESPSRRLLYRENSDGTKERSFESIQDLLFDPVDVTQAEYEEEYAILNSGKVMDFEVKDFTAENLGL